MTPGPLPKNPNRVPWLSQVIDPVGTETGSGPGVTIVRPEPGAPGSAYPQESPMSEHDTIKSDGVYEDRLGNRFQYRKGHVLAPGAARALKRVGDYPEPLSPADAAAKAEADAPENRAEAAAPENKAAPAPATKKP